MDGTWNIAALQQAMGSKLDIIAQPPVTSASSKYAHGDTSMGSGDFSAGNPIVVSATAQREGRLDLAVDFLRYYSSPKIFGPLTLEQGLVPMVKGAQTPGPLEQKAIKWFISRPCLFGAASDQLGAELYGAHQNLCTGYLSGSVDLKSALRQLQSVQQRVVDKIIAQDHVKLKAKRVTARKGRRIEIDARRQDRHRRRDWLHHTSRSPRPPRQACAPCPGSIGLSLPAADPGRRYRLPILSGPLGDLSRVYAVGWHWSRLVRGVRPVPGLH